MKIDALDRSDGSGCRIQPECDLFGSKARDDPVEINGIHEADESCDEIIGRMIVNFGRRSELLNSTLVHDADSVGYFERLVLIVGDEDSCGAESSIKSTNFVANFFSNLCVEIGRAHV